MREKEDPNDYTCQNVDASRWVSEVSIMENGKKDKKE